MAPLGLNRCTECGIHASAMWRIGERGGERVRVPVPRRGLCSSCIAQRIYKLNRKPVTYRHSNTGERMCDLETEVLRDILSRSYRLAADMPPDRRAARAELRRRTLTSDQTPTRRQT